MKNACFVIISLIMPSLLFCQRGLPKNAKPGKCYIRCITPEKYDSEIHTYPIYTGENYEGIDLEILEIEVMPALSRYELKKSPGGCKSDDPRDCMVLCLVEKPAVIETLVIVLDTSQTSEYEMTEVKIHHLLDEGGVAIWEEVECHLTDYNLLDIDFKRDNDSLDEKDKKEIIKRLLKLLKNKPNFRVEISSHTASRGDAERNRKLSQARADAVKSYLVAEGIQASRILAKGYGESRPVNHCVDGVHCSEEEHSQNVRTEFRVLSN